MTKHAGGRPSEFDVVNLDQLRYLLEVKGFTDQELADFYGKSRTTITNWKAAHPEFLATIKLSKDAADSKVETSLFENATQERNVTAQIFWLKNRKPGTWREKLEVVDDRFANLLNHINRKEAQHGQVNQEPATGAGRAGPGGKHGSAARPVHRRLLGPGRHGQGSPGPRRGLGRAPPPGAREGRVRPAARGAAFLAAAALLGFAGLLISMLSACAKPKPVPQDTPPGEEVYEEPKQELVRPSRSFEAFTRQAPAKSGPLRVFYFDLNGTRLKDTAEARRLARYLLVSGDAARIEGHTCPLGSEGYNLTLGLRRAEALRAYLVRAGVLGGRLELVSLGELRPIATDEQAYPMNRRVEVYLP